MVIVYSKPNCPPCAGTYRALDKAGVEYESRDITTDPAAHAAASALGYAGAPVVFVNDDWHWTGFRPTEIAKLIA